MESFSAAGGCAPDPCFCYFNTAVGTPLQKILATPLHLNFENQVKNIWLHAHEIMINEILLQAQYSFNYF